MRQPPSRTRADSQWQDEEGEEERERREEGRGREEREEATRPPRTLEKHGMDYHISLRISEMTSKSENSPIKLHHPSKNDSL